MLIPELDHAAIVQNNLDEYGPDAATMRWLNLQEAAQTETIRENLLYDIRKKGLFLFNNTKPFHKNISPGCRLCGEGAWSCLFINNLCNAGCFFCPARQDNPDEPGTSTLTFSSPKDYADYLEEFNFTGASISGGEPLLTLDKTVSFVKHIKERLGKRIYLWLYTNGTLVTEEKLGMLADAGLNEIRFNITATGYDLAKARMASRIIENVTVEIPAIPEDYETMKAKISEMADTGISFLNLHQIRCTKHNGKQLSEHGYTFLHGPQIGILESELTALKLLRYALAEDINLGVNYCSLIYRHRFQTRSSRARWAPLMTKPFEEVTKAGMIRIIRMDGQPDTMAQAIRLSYAIATVRPGITYHNPFKEIRLASGKKIAIERAMAFMDIELSGPEIELFRDAFLENHGYEEMDAVYKKALALDLTGSHAKKWQKIIQAEALRSGLLEYY
jgi:pyruvate formate-lyase activating enzyme-like uncharacterized protein